MKAKVISTCIRVALVEDDASLRGLFKGWIQSTPDLEMAGEFADAESAMKQLPSHPPDVVLVDIKLPACNGIE